jgi:hypothetical protein
MEITIQPTKDLRQDSTEADRVFGAVGGLISGLSGEFEIMRQGSGYSIII